MQRRWAAVLPAGGEIPGSPLLAASSRLSQPGEPLSAGCPLCWRTALEDVVAAVGGTSRERAECRCPVSVECRAVGSSHPTVSVYTERISKGAGHRGGMTQVRIR